MAGLGKKPGSVPDTGPNERAAGPGLKKPAQDPARKKTRPEVVPYPTAGRKVTEFEDRLDAAIAKGEQEPKRGRGRPKKIEEPPPPEIDIKVFASCLQIPFDLWSVSQDAPELKLSMPEAVMLAKPMKQLADYYLPNVPEIAWAWFSLAGVSYTIVKSRLVLIAEIKKASSVDQKDAARGVVVPQEKGVSHPSDKMPTLEQIKSK